MENPIKKMKGYFNDFIDLPSKFKIQVLLETICEEFEFAVGLFYKIMDDNKNYISCYNQPYFLSVNSSNFNKFLNFSSRIRIKKGSDMVGRVWESQKFEWAKDVQFEPSDSYLRRRYIIAEEC